MSSYRFIKKVVLDDSDGVSIWQVNNLFTDDFSVYKVVWSGISLNTSTTDIDLRLTNSFGDIIDNANYAYGVMDFAGSSLNQYRSNSGNNIDKIGGIAGVKPFVANGSMIIHEPMEAQKYTMYQIESAGSQSTTVERFRFGGGMLRLNIKVGGIAFLPESNSLVSGEVKVYGFRT